MMKTDKGDAMKIIKIRMHLDSIITETIKMKILVEDNTDTILLTTIIIDISMTNTITIHNIINKTTTQDTQRLQKGN